MANSVAELWKKKFSHGHECELVSTSDTLNAYKNPLCCKCVSAHSKATFPL